MILTALDAAYRRLSSAEGDDALPPLGFSLAKVVGAVCIDADGGFRGLLDLRRTEGKKQLPRLMQVPQPPQRTVKVVPGFLCDNAGYLCGHDRKGKADRAAKQFEASAELHARLLAGIDDPAARAVLAWFEHWDLNAAAETLAEHEDLLDGWLVFRVDLPGAPTGVYAHDVPALREAWVRHAATEEAGAAGQCLVTGETGPIARLHGAIKGVQGAQSSGASLVSFNIAAATSYGKDQSFNAPVGEAAAFGYVTALNHLLRRDLGQTLSMGDTTMVFWAERATEAETVIPALADPAVAEWHRIQAEEKAKHAERAHATRMLDLLERLRAGKQVDGALLDAAEVRFFVLGLAPNAARLSVRFWDTAPVKDMLARLAAHHQDTALEKDFPNRPAFPSLWALAQETRPKDRDGKARGANSLDAMKKLHGDIARAVLTGGPYPSTLPALLLARFRADGHVTHPRVALLKAEYNRRRRHAGHPEEMIAMSLDPDRKDVGYRLGRLFAVLERIQDSAHGGSVNAGVGQKFMASASATPQAVFPHLLRLKEAHMKKVVREGRGLSVWFERLVAEIVDDIGDIPANLLPDQQGLFFLGYYQQRQALFRKAEKPDAEPSDYTDTAA